MDIPDLAARQDGIVSREQLLAAGWSPKRIRRAAGDGRLHPVYTGAYALGHAEISHRGRVRAAQLSCGPDSRPTGWWALLLHECVKPQQRPVGVLVPRQIRPRDGIDLRLVAYAENEWTGVNAIPVATATRALLDLAAGKVSAKQLTYTIGQAYVQRRTSEPQIRKIIEANKGARGTGLLLAALGVADRTRSYSEEKVARYIRDAELPKPQRNVLVAGWEWDFWYPQFQLAIEVDGPDFHAHREALANDHEKDADLMATGAIPLRLTADDAEHPTRVIARITRQLAVQAQAA